MKGRTIVRGKAYTNCFVAMPSFNSNTVVAHGKDAEKVRQQAEQKGHLKPVIVFVPPKNTVNLY